MKVKTSITDALEHLVGLPLNTQIYISLWDWVTRLVEIACHGDKGAGHQVTQKMEEVGGACVSTIQSDIQDIPAAGESEKMEVDLVDDEPIASSGASCNQSCNMVEVAETGHAEVVSTSSSKDYVGLLQLSFYGVALCFVRFPAFFKPLHRMAATLLRLSMPQVCQTCIF